MLGYKIMQGSHRQISQQ